MKDQQQQQQQQDDDDDQERRRRRSSGYSNSNSSTMNIGYVTFTLCVVMFAHSYLLISVFPYSGFMAMDLLGERVTTENVGSYAGLISASFMVGRALSSYAWGRLADTYGRVATLLLSLALSGATTTLFGLSSTFGVACFWRFCLGLSNGLISTTKVLVSEISGNDKKREAKVMNTVMSMWGGAFLIAPAISGALAEPLQQYPSLTITLQVNSGWWYNLLQRFPFFLPNLVGLLICVLGIVSVHFSIKETLPLRKLRSPKHIPVDTMRACWGAIASLLSACRNIIMNKKNTDEQTPLIGAGASSDNSGYNSHKSTRGGGENDEDVDGTHECHCPPINEGEEGGNFEDNDNENDFVALIERDVEDAIRSSQLYSNYYSATSAIATKRARTSVVSSVTRKCKCPPGRTGCCCISGVAGVEAAQRIRENQQMMMKEAEEEEGSLAEQEQQQRRRRRSSLLLPPATMSSLWANAKAKNLMLVHWFGSFLMVSLDEAFPLFCLSPQHGLALQENSIGQILSISGIIFLVMQLLFYPPIVDKMGLFGSMVLGCAAMPPLTLLLSTSLLLNRNGDDNGGGGGDLTWAAFLFLTIDMAFARSADLTFFTGITVAINSQVPPAHRGTLNGLNNLGGSVAQAIGPVFAGLLVAFSFSSGLFSGSSYFGAVFLFGTIAVLNTVTAVAAYRLLREDEEEEESIELTK